MDVQTLINHLTFKNATYIRIMNGETQYYYGSASNLQSEKILSMEVDSFYTYSADILYVIVRK